MITEQDVVDYLNKKVASGDLGPVLEKYVAKLKSLQDMRDGQEDDIASLKTRLEQAESLLLKTQGAISMILELAAEEENLLPPAQKPNNSSDEAKSKQ